MLRAAVRSLLAHKLRLLLSGLAIVLGVGFVVGTLIFTDTLNKTFTDLFTQTTTDVVVSPRTDVSSDAAGSVATLPASMLTTVQGVSGVAKAGGAILVDGVTVIGTDGKPLGTQGAPQYGSNWDDDQQLTPFRLVSGHGPTAPGQVALDSVAADTGGYTVGDTVQLVTPNGPKKVQLVGIFRFGSSGNLAGATITAFETRAAQQLLLDGHDAYTEIDAMADPGVSQAELAQRVSSALPANVKVQTGQQSADEAAKQINDALKFVNVFLLVFAGIALVVGIFIILNTFSMLVGQRSRELALLRAVGATRGQVIRSVLFEAFLVGLIGSLVGLVLGIVVAFGLQGLFKAIGADIPTSGMSVEPRTIVVGLTVGLVVTIVAALVPAVRASRIPPVAALRDDFTLPQRSLRVRGIVGAVVLGLGLVSMTAGVAAGSGQGAAFVGLGTIVTLIGAAVLSPVLAGPVVSALGFVYPRLFGTVGRLALDNAHRQPRRTAATASALMIGLALVSALTIFATSTSASVDQAITKVIGAEFIVTNQAQRPFPSTVASDAADVPGVSSVSAVQQVPAKADGDGTLVTGIDPQTLQNAFDLPFTQGGWDSITPGTFALDDKAVADANLSLGDALTFTFPGGKQEKLTLSAVYDGAAGLTGYVVSSQQLQEAGLAVGDSVLYVSADQGADLATVQADLEKTLAAYPTVQVQSQAQFKESIQGNVNQLLAVMVLLLSLAILIAVLGIVNTLVLSVIERTREIGLLRAVGALRKQVRRMVVLEAVVIAAFGAVLGLVLGIGFAVALQRTLVDQGITILSIPWVTMVIFFVLAALVGALAALWPAFRAGRLDVLQAVTTE